MSNHIHIKLDEDAYATVSQDVKPETINALRHLASLVRKKLKGKKQKCTGCKRKVHVLSADGLCNICCGASREDIF